MLQPIDKMTKIICISLYVNVSFQDFHGHVTKHITVEFRYSETDLGKGGITLRMRSRTLGEMEYMD